MIQFKPITKEGEEVSNKLSQKISFSSPIKIQGLIWLRSTNTDWYYIVSNIFVPFVLLYLIKKTALDDQAFILLQSPKPVLTQIGLLRFRLFPPKV